jgi:glycerol-3-phosphate acyltransferase PlsY
VIEGWWGIGAAIISSYMLGSIPTGYLYGRLRGLDIRKQGSGNLGATNVLRVLGWQAGLLVLTLDISKGLAAVAFLPRLTPYPAMDYLRVACGLAAVFGHTYTLFLGFKGGKGVATGCGVFLALAPLAACLALLIFVTLVAATRYVSVGSLTAAIFLPLLIWLTGEAGRSSSVWWLSLLLLVGIIFLHRKNIQRLRQGTELRLGQKAAGGKP